MIEPWTYNLDECSVKKGSYKDQPVITIREDKDINNREIVFKFKAKCELDMDKFKSIIEECMTEIDVDIVKR